MPKNQNKGGGGRRGSGGLRPPSPRALAEMSNRRQRAAAPRATPPPCSSTSHHARAGRAWPLARGDNSLTQNNKTPAGSRGIYEAGFRGIPRAPGAQTTNVPRNSMPDQPVSDSQHFRDLAGKTRAKADQTDGVAKRLLLRIAETMSA